MKENDKNILVPYAKYKQLVTTGSKPSTDNKESELSIGNVLDTVSDEDRAVTKALLSFLHLKNPNWKWDSHGKIQTNGKTWAGTNLADLLLYMQGKKDGIPEGWQRFSRLFQGILRSTRAKPKSMSDKSMSDKSMSDKVRPLKLPPPPPSVYLKQRQQYLSDNGKKVQKKKSQNNIQARVSRRSGQTRPKLQWHTLP